MTGVGRGTWPFLDIGFIIFEVVAEVLALAEAMRVAMGGSWELSDTG